MCACNALDKKKKMKKWEKSDHSKIFITYNWILVKQESA
jgi:hypothetical protein